MLAGGHKVELVPEIVVIAGREQVNSPFNAAK
jgi:hypothetical protein